MHIHDLVQHCGCLHYTYSIGRLWILIYYAKIAIGAIEWQFAERLSYSPNFPYKSSLS